MTVSLSANSMRVVLVPILVMLSSTFVVFSASARASTGGAGAAQQENELTQQVIAAKNQADRSGETMVRFAAGGFWDATTDEAYINEGARVALLVRNKLVDRDRGTAYPDVRTLGDPAASTTDTCSVTDNLTHCESVINTPGCDPTYAYLRYVNDDFMAPYGPAAYPGERINVRNSPYRAQAPRGVRVFRTAEWLWMSDNCL